MNVVCLVGRLTADPDMRKTPNEIDVCSFSVAVGSSQKNTDGTYKTDFINCVAWRASAEFISKYFKKGQMIGINGAIQTRQYQDRDTGKNRTAFEVLVNNIYFVEGKKGTSEKSAATSPQAVQQGFSTGNLDDFSTVASEDGDLPF